ncbi:arylsulfatase [Botrimarina sp.]|uniref:arylsulfatase n=1 Tax=Botrimarina sp. TaxID=2795802 RepID=UPI0032EE583B
MLFGRPSLFAVLLLAPAALATEPLAGSRPNVVVVITDDQGYGVLGRHGHPWIETPNLDRLYDASTRFTRFLVSPTCAPTRSALMTGRHPMRNGVTHTIFERERLTLDAVTLPQALGRVGYTTAIFGKWHLGDEDPYQPQNRGFDEAFVHGAGGIGQAYNCSCADAPGNSYFDPVIRHNGRFVQTKGFCTDVFFSAALGWIDAQRAGDQPFFAYIATNAPHDPFHAPEANRQKFERLGFDENKAGFYGMVENIDENVGRLLDRLAEWDLTESTVVVFMSDNGTVAAGAGEEGEQIGRTPEGQPLRAYNAGMAGMKGSVDEGGVRVPLFVRWDGRVEAGRDVDTLAAHVDFAPTIAALAGAELPPQQVEGRSLLPLVAGDAGHWPPRYLFTHRGRWPVGAEPNDHQWEHFAVRDQQHRLVGRDELYDMTTDPGQTTNLADQRPEVVRSMLAAYDRWWRGTRPLMVNERAPMSPTRPFHEAYRRQQREGGLPDWRAPAF